jgi:hypothetical protein
MNPSAAGPLMAMDDKDIESKVYISLNKEHNFIVIERE